MNLTRTAVLLLFSLCYYSAMAQTVEESCPVCTLKGNILAYKKGHQFYLEARVADTTKVKMGKLLTGPMALRKYQGELLKTLNNLWDRKSPSELLAFVNRFSQDVVNKFFPDQIIIPTFIDSISLPGTGYMGLAKTGGENFLISLYAPEKTTDLFQSDAVDSGFIIHTLLNAEYLKLLPAVLFLKDSIARINSPDLILVHDSTIKEINLAWQNELGDTTIFKKIDLPASVVRSYDILAARIGDVYRQQPEIKEDYIESIRRKLNIGCDGCEITKEETLLIYDHECQRFLVKRSGTNDVELLGDLAGVSLQYKHPFKIMVVNLNRYIYNFNFATSDIALTSSESSLMQQYLLPGSTNGQVTPTNTYTNGGSWNGADYVFGNIASFKANIDYITNKLNRIQPAITTTEKNDTLENLRNSVNNNEDPYSKLSNQKYRTFYDSADVVRSFLSENYGAQSTQVLRLDQLTDSSRKNDAVNGLKTTAKSLQDMFRKLNNYCDSFIDNRIKAYSLCVDSFPCCQTSLETYAHFESYLTNISTQMIQYRIAKQHLDSVTNELQQKLQQKQDSIKTAQKKSQDSVAQVKKLNYDKQHHITEKPTDNGSVPNPVVLKISTTDLKFTDGQITAVTLHQIPDTAKPKKADSAADPLNAIDTLWYNFEKSIPTDYIMRQIIFKNNMIRKNMYYISAPISPNGDRLGLVMQIPVSDTVKRMGIMPASTTTFSSDIPVFGKPLFSFSAGTFVGFGVRSKTYEWQQVPQQGSNLVQSSSPYQLVNTGPGSIPIGLEGMANITWRFPHYIHWPWAQHNLWLGFTGGVGAVVTPTPVEIGYMVGGTISIGTYQQFHLTFGPLAMNVNVLKDNLSTTNQYQDLPSIQQYNQKIRIGTFLAISYTIFSPKGTGTMQNQVINAN
jgi:hypothetical protein